MIAVIWGALTSRLAGPIGAGIAALLALALAWQTAQLGVARGALKRAQGQVEALNRDLGICHANVEALDGAIAAQNKALAARSAEDAQSLATATKRLSEAVKGRESAEAMAAKLLKVGPVGADACARAMSAFATVKDQAR